MQDIFDFLSFWSLRSFVWRFFRYGNAVGSAVLPSGILRWRICLYRTNNNSYRISLIFIMTYNNVYEKSQKWYTNPKNYIQIVFLIRWVGSSGFVCCFWCKSWFRIWGCCCCYVVGLLVGFGESFHFRTINPLPAFFTQADTLYTCAMILTIRSTFHFLILIFLLLWWFLFLIFFYSCLFIWTAFTSPFFITDTYLIYTFPMFAGVFAR